MPSAGRCAVNGFLVAGGLVATLVALAWCSRAIVANAFGTEIGRAALESQPDLIHLDPAGERPWKGSEPESIASQIAQLGFDSAGTWRVREMPVVVHLLANSVEHLYACVYQHEKVGCWFDFSCRFADGGGATFTTARETGLDPRPGHPTFHAPGARATGLYSRAVSERPQHLLAPVSVWNAVHDFEEAYAEHVAWLKGRGISTREVVRVAMKKAV